MVGSERTGNRAYHRAIIFIFAMLIITIMLTTSSIIIMLNIIIIIIIMLATTLSIIIMLTTWVFFKECSLLPITKGAQHGLLRSSLPDFFVGFGFFSSDNHLDEGRSDLSLLMDVRESGLKMASCQNFLFKMPFLGLFMKIAICPTRSVW